MGGALVHDYTGPLSREPGGAGEAATPAWSRRVVDWIRSSARAATWFTAIPVGSALATPWAARSRSITAGARRLGAGVPGLGVPPGSHACRARCADRARAVRPDRSSSAWLGVQDRIWLACTQLRRLHLRDGALSTWRPRCCSGASPWRSARPGDLAGIAVVTGILGTFAGGFPTDPASAFPNLGVDLAWSPCCAPHRRFALPPTPHVTALFFVACCSCSEQAVRRR
jgi:hypothetical protein